MQPQSQAQQQAGQKLETALEQLEQAHGFFSGINWAALVPLILEFIRIISTGKTIAQAPAPPAP